MIFLFGDFELDIDRREIRLFGDAVPVEPKVFDLLHFMVQNKDRVLSKDELVEEVWQGRFISDSAVSSAIKFARKVVGDNGKEQHTIKTVFGKGFRFVKEVRLSDETAQDSHAAVTEVVTPEIGQQAPTNIIRSLTPLDGREDETEKLIGLISERPLVSIVGPGGVGKSALAQEVGRRAIDRFRGGVWFCEFASANETQLESVVLGALDGSAGAGAVNVSQIAERLGNAPTLLILDNCEHVIDAAAAFVADLAAKHTSLKIMTTSREPLDVPGEQLLRISGLDYTSEDAAAVKMLRNRASEVVDLPETTENKRIFRQIAERLEGLPLAIELAAPRLAFNTPSELLATLDDQLRVSATRRRSSTARHSTIDAAIAWSYELLEEDQREVLLALSVFAGKFTIEAASAVCGRLDTAEIVHRLVQQSVVSFVPSSSTSRFKLLEPIRQFAHRKLDDEASAEIRQRHAEWFAARTITMAKEMRGADEIAACDALTEEWPDLGRALEWGRDNVRPDIALDPLLALHVHLLWQLRIEAFAWINAGVTACGQLGDRRAAVKLLQSMGRWSAGDLEQSEKLLEESVKAGGEVLETTYFRFYQAFAREDFLEVNQAAEAAWELAVECGNPAWMTSALAFRTVGRTMVNPGDPDIPGFLDELDRRIIEWPWPSGECCTLLAKLTWAFMRGDAEQGEAYRRELDVLADRCRAPWFKITASGVGAPPQTDAVDALAKVIRSAESMRIAVSSGDVMQLPTMVRFAAMELWEIGDVETAAQIVGFVPKVRGLGEKGTLAPGYDETVKNIREALPMERLKELLALGRRLTLDDAVDLLDVAVQRAQVDNPWRS
ncbi:winged helix-turn-helix domain-containing protein [uncultured Aliiroseovarius sp.]|uniref:winged helix-turn-helix domain-containing protein n=1 Tax=uncultured Aliiroseovarius sp. TaxID=1658783 RepID=UPI0026364C25|nr:winged helix-turn-helix domain-containing protein [uncultured Aliiroseovarius sp.]